MLTSLFNYIQTCSESFSGRKLRLFLAMTLCFFSIPGSQSYGYGHLKELNDPYWRSAHLVFPVLSRHQIKFCMAIDASVKDRFEESSLQEQVEFAIHTWLAPAQSQGLSPNGVELLNVPCSSPRLDLKVMIGPDPQHSQLGGYHTTEQNLGREYTVIRLNSDFKNDPQTTIIDFKTLIRAKDNSDLLGIMKQLNQTPGYPIEAAAKQVDVSFPTMYLSSYAFIIHEMGHAFGLCDTLATRIKDSCDAHYLTNQYTGSVMSDSAYLSLTPDDKAGIISLFARFKGK